MRSFDLPLALLAFAALLSAVAGWMQWHPEGLQGPPGSMGDDVYFENIAFQLAGGEGVSFDFANRNWKQPYRDANGDGRNDWILHLHHSGVTTSRAPGFPWVVSLIYRGLGRNFGAIRIMNGIALALALSVLVAAVAARHGRLVGLLATLTIAMDFYVLRTAGMFMTEALGTAIVSLLFAACLILARRGPRRTPAQLAGWFGVGILFGFGTLVRANLNAWFLLFVAGGSLYLIVRLWQKREVRFPLAAGLVFTAGVIVVASPWWVRNCRVTDGFAPFGTSGSFGLVGGYCDAAYHDFGNWNLEASVASQQASLQRPGIRDLPLARQEFLMGQDSVERSRDWVVQHPLQTPLLMVMKAISHLGFYRQPAAVLLLNGLLFFGAAIGCWATRDTTARWFLLFLGLSVVTTSLTWPHYGRYSIPLRPLVHVASAVGTVWFWTSLFRLRSDRGQSHAKYSTISAATASNNEFL